MKTENIPVKESQDQQVSGPIILTKEEVTALQEMLHLEEGHRLSNEGAIKWHNFSSNNQIDALIYRDVQELRKKTSYKSAMSKIFKLSSPPAGVYDEVV